MLKIKVPDMSCGGCASSVEKAVKRVDPNARVEVDLSSKVVTVETTAEDQQIADAVQAAGFKNERLAA